jgi:hypothetical protein
VLVVTGRGNKLVGQAGEYLVAGELSRRGLISTTFTGNVPHYDIVASNEAGLHLSVQVKSSVGGSWHLSIASFCEIDFSDDRQEVGPMKQSPVLGLICVFVHLLGQGQDRFFVLPWKELRDLVVADYSRWLNMHDGVRPKNPRSLHCALLERQIVDFENNWNLLAERLGEAAV